MISLIDITRFHGPAAKPRLLLSNVCLRVEPTDRIGILAPSGSGKSTLARIMTGREQPDAGEVVRRCTISWPVGFSAMLHPNLTCAENVSIIAKLWNLDPIEFTARVDDFSELGAQFYRPVSELSPGKRAQLGLSISLNSNPDIFLADDMSAASDPEFRDKCDAAMEDKLASAGLVIMSRHPRVISQYAQKIHVLANTQLIECSDIQQAQDILKLYQNEDTHAHAA